MKRLEPPPLALRPTEQSDTSMSVRVWQALTQMFGSAFAAAYGESPPRIWVDAIEGLTSEELTRGMRVLRDGEYKYPPNLTQFVAACKPKKPGPPRYLGTPLTEAEQRRLLAPQSTNPAIRDKYLAHMRSLFGPSREPGEDDEA